MNQSSLNNKIIRNLQKKSKVKQFNFLKMKFLITLKNKEKAAIFKPKIRHDASAIKAKTAQCQI